MQMLTYKALTASTAASAEIGRLALSPAISTIFRDLAVPPDPDWQKRAGYTRQLFNDTSANRIAAAGLVWAASQAPVAILSDIDGTCRAFSNNVATGGIVIGYAGAAEGILAADSDSAFSFITGRSEEDALAIFGGKADLPMICSHGTVRLHGDTRETILLQPAEEAFVRTLHDFAKGFEGGDRVVQYKHSGIDIKDHAGNDIGRIVESMRDLCKGQTAFGVHQEGPLEASVRFENADKAYAVRHFMVNRLTAPALLVYIGDSYAPNGTDRRAAEYVQSRGGIAVQVLNDRPANCPGPSDSFQPDIVLPNPQAAAALLQAVAVHKGPAPSGLRL